MGPRHLSSQILHKKKYITENLFVQLKRLIPRSANLRLRLSFSNRFLPIFCLSQSSQHKEAAGNDQPTAGAVLLLPNLSSFPFYPASPRRSSFLSWFLCSWVTTLGVLKAAMCFSSKKFYLFRPQSFSQSLKQSWLNSSWAKRVKCSSCI